MIHFPLSSNGGINENFLTVSKVLSMIFKMNQIIQGVNEDEIVVLKI